MSGLARHEQQIQGQVTTINRTSAAV